MLAPVGMAMLYRVFPPDERIKAAAILTVPTTFAPALGPVLGGLFVTELSWRWVFYVNLPIGAAAFAFGAIFLRQPGQAEPGRFDLAGFLLSGFGLGLLMYGVSEGPDLGWHDTAGSGDDRRRGRAADRHGRRRAEVGRAHRGPAAAAEPPVPLGQRGHGPGLDRLPGHAVRHLAVLPGRPRPERARLRAEHVPRGARRHGRRDSWPAGCSTPGSGPGATSPSGWPG